MYACGRASGNADFEENKARVLHAILRAQHVGPAEPGLADDCPEALQLQRVGERVLEAARRHADELISKLEANVSESFPGADSQQASDKLQEALIAKRRLSHDYTFVLSTSEMVNAMVSPYLPHHVIVHKGFFDKLEPTDAELAFVLAHELSHVSLDHPAKSMLRHVVSLQAQLLVLSFMDPTKVVSLICSVGLGVVFDGLLHKTFSRDCEILADKMAGSVVQQASFELTAARAIVKRIGLYRSGHHRQRMLLMEWLDTHPPLRERIKQFAVDEEEIQK